MTKKILVPISEGFEEIEAMTIVNTLRRADLNVIFAGLDTGDVEGRSGIRVIPDMDLEEAIELAPFDMIVLPGGLPNAYSLRDDKRVISLLQQNIAQNRPVAAICAAPAALYEAGLLKDKKATNYPALKSDLKGVDYQDESVVEDDLIITSRGPGTAIEFSLAIIEKLCGKQKAMEISDALVY